MEPTPEVRVEWRDGGGRTRLVRVTELGRLMWTDPNFALSVLDGLVRREAGKSAGGMDPQRKGWVRLQDRAGETSSSSSTSIGGRRPPPKAPKPPPRPSRKNPASRVARKTPPTPQPSRASPRPRPSPRTRARAKPPPSKPQAPSLQDRGRDPYGNVTGVGDTRHVPWEEGGNGETVSQVTVLGDWDEELDPGGVVGGVVGVQWGGG